MSENVKRIMNSYTRGIAKSMDMNYKIRVINKTHTANIYSAWKDVGLELSQVIELYSKNGDKIFHA
jgi:hypothetical protein